MSEPKGPWHTLGNIVGVMGLSALVTIIAGGWVAPFITSLKVESDRQAGVQLQLQQRVDMLERELAELRKQGASKGQIDPEKKADK